MNGISKLKRFYIDTFYKYLIEAGEKK